jgi:hypothetical protein
LIRDDYDLIVEVRKANLERVAQLGRTDFIEMLFVPRANAVGSWQIKLPVTAFDSVGNQVPNRVANLLRQPGYGIVVTERIKRGSTWVSRPLISGPMRMVKRDADANNPDGMWTISGVSDLTLLAEREAWPDPAVPFPQNATRADDTREGPAETVITDFVLHNMGPFAVEARRAPGFTTVNTQGRGPYRKKTARFTNLLKLCQEIAVGADLFFDIVDVDGQLRLLFRESEYLEADIRLDIDNGSAESETSEYGAPKATHVYVLGAGDGTDRVIVDGTTATDPTVQAWDVRIEKSLDLRGTEDNAELTQHAEKYLQENGYPSRTFRVVPSAEISLDFQLGDYVTAVVADTENSVQVTERPVSVNAAGVFVGATLGDPFGIDWESDLNKRQDSVETRVSSLEKYNGGGGGSGGGLVYVQPNEPVGVPVGTLWFDTDGGYY